MTDTVSTETVDYIALRRLQNAYADIVSRRAFDELDTVFRADTTLTIDLGSGGTRVFRGPTEIGRLIGGVVNPLDHFMFVILNTVMQIGVDGDPDVAKARLYLWEIHSDPRTGRRSDLFGVYHDRHERIEGRWWFTERRYHRMARTGPGLDTSGFPSELNDFI
jgi:hypothetical protein